MRTLCCVLALLLPTTVPAGEPPPLQNNPFSRPPAPVVREETRTNLETRNAQLVLIATMVSTMGSFANVEGIVMRPGHEVRGYVLKRVFEDRAVFERDGNELTVYVKPELEENNERSLPEIRRR